MSERKSNKQRRAEIKQKRLERASRLQSDLQVPDVRWAARGATRQAGVEPADRECLARHNNTYGLLPEYYLDTPFTCRDCGEEQVWTAKQQKWWYESVLAPIDSRAVRCLSCRRARRAANDRPGSRLLSELCARVRALGDRPPDVAAWREIEDALANKWWGVRTIAMATLGRWGGDQATERLKTWASIPMPKRWGGWDYEARCAALKALGECLPASEADWALELVLANGDAWELHRALGTQPLAFWEAALATEWRRDEPARLERLCWLMRDAQADTSQRQRWQQRFRSHHDAVVCRAAEYAWS
jgi:Probable zinc-ribbon domain